MPSTTHARPHTAALVLLAAVLAALLGFGLAALYDPARAAAPAAVTPLVFDRIDAIPGADPAADVPAELLAVAFGPGADYSTAQADEVARVAGTVRADLAAGTAPEALLPDLCTRTGMLPEQARAFVAAVAGLSA
jgi:hypothetical protein